MNSDSLSIDLQRLYVQAWKKFGPELDRLKAEEARSRTEAEKWIRSQEVQRSGEATAVAPRELEDFESNGLVIQQRYFRKLAPR